MYVDCRWEWQALLLTNVLIYMYPLCLFVGSEFVAVQKEVAGLLKGRVLVGHGLRHDLKVRRKAAEREKRRLRRKTRL